MAKIYIIGTDGTNTATTLGTGVETFLATPTSANLAAIITNETGSATGTPLLVFNQAPVISAPYIDRLASDDGDTLVLLTGQAGTIVNYVEIRNAASGNNPQILGGGTDGHLLIGSTTASSGTIQFVGGAAGAIEKFNIGATTRGTGAFTTLNASGDLTVGSNVIGSAAAMTITGAAGNMTITAGTGNSRTITLKTTTSAAALSSAVVFSESGTVGTATFGDGTNHASYELASNLSGATDPKITFGNALITASNAITVTSGSITASAGNLVATSNNGGLTLNGTTPAAAWNGYFSLKSSISGTATFVNDTVGNPMALAVTNTYTSATSHEAIAISWASNVGHVGAIKGSGGGTARVMQLDYGGTSTAAISIPITSGGITIESVANFKGIATEGNGLAAIVKSTRITAQSAAGTIATYTAPAADGSYEVSANLNVSAATSLATTITCAYTDESNTARTMIMPITPLDGNFTAAGAITAAGSAVFHTPVLHIRVKASTAITLATTAGTFTGVTFTAEAQIKQIK